VPADVLDRYEDFKVCTLTKVTIARHVELCVLYMALMHKFQKEGNRKGGAQFDVERTFANLDLFRRIILRYDAKIVHFKSFHFLAGCYLVGK
jgi:hypothetical protein